MHNNYGYLEKQRCLGSGSTLASEKTALTAAAMSSSNDTKSTPTQHT